MTYGHKTNIETLHKFRLKPEETVRELGAFLNQKSAGDRTTCGRCLIVSAFCGNCMWCVSQSLPTAVIHLLVVPLFRSRLEHWNNTSLVCRYISYVISNQWKQELASFSKLQDIWLFSSLLRDFIGSAYTEPWHLYETQWLVSRIPCRRQLSSTSTRNLAVTLARCSSILVIALFRRRNPDLE
jgi:hypothetical protein